ncbi:MAG: TIGR03617 family F420-dependent LLM class oxidoreductase [Candidatus Binatia bacterium]
MALAVETGLLNPETDQYAGKGVRAWTLRRVAESARAAESLGFDGLCTPEAGHDPFLPLMVAAEHSSTISLGTNVAIAFPRSPMVTAQLAWDLQQYSDGRFKLGLGTQVKGHNERRYSSPWSAAPGPRMREYLLCLKAMFDSFSEPAKPSFFEGDHYRFTMIPPFFNPGPIDYSPPAIYIAAVNSYMTGLAGELCDGVRLHPIGTFRYTKEVVLGAIESGARKAGRRLTDVDLVGAPFIATGAKEEEVEAAKKALKQHIAFYASTRSYHTVLEFHGWEDIGRRLHELAGQGKWTDMAALIDDDMLEEWAIVATHDEFAARVKQRCEGVFTTVLLDLPPAMLSDEDLVRETVTVLHGS